MSDMPLWETVLLAAIVAVNSYMAALTLSSGLWFFAGSHILAIAIGLYLMVDGQ